MIRKYLWRILALSCIFSVFCAGFAVSYLTDKTEAMLNPFTIALDSTTTVVEKYPVPDEDAPNTPVPDGTAIDYEKAVQIGNTGYIDCYVRVSIDFSEEDIRNKSYFSSDGVNWYTIDEYDNHLPAGWTKNKTDGFYYYKPIVYAQGWPEVADKLYYDKNLGEHFYPDDVRDLISAQSITAPLIRYVKTQFSSPSDMRTYDIHVYDESVPFYFGNDYSQAWENYLAIRRGG